MDNEFPSIDAQKHRCCRFGQLAQKAADNCLRIGTPKDGAGTLRAIGT
jgi:hypothetical protein